MKLDLTGITPRTGQAETFEKLAGVPESTKYVLLSAPVGSGKSYAAIAAARGVGSAFITTPQNVLISQYDAAFQDLSVVKGARHYHCGWAKDKSGRLMDCGRARQWYEDAHAKNCRDYVPARDTFWCSPISATNIHFLYFAEPPKDLRNAQPHRRLLVIDEAHGLERTLLDLFKTEVYREDCELLGVGFSKEAFSHFIERAKHVRPADEDDHGAFIQPEIRASEGQRERIRKTARNLRLIDLNDQADPWFTDQDNDRIQLCPLTARKAAQRLFRRADTVLFMSGTPGDPETFFRNLGITESKRFVEVDSTFPKGKGICLAPGSPFRTAKSMAREMPGLVRTLDGLLSQPDASGKGVILCARCGVSTGCSDRELIG